MFTEHDMQRQQEEYAALQEELTHLDSQFAALLKSGNFSREDVEKAAAEPIPQELASMLEAAKEQATRVGSARAMQAQPARQGKTPGRGRPGIVRL